MNEEVLDRINEEISTELQEIILSFEACCSIVLLGGAYHERAMQYIDNFRDCEDVHDIMYALAHQILRVRCECAVKRATHRLTTSQIMVSTAKALWRKIRYYAAEGCLLDGNTGEIIDMDYVMESINNGSLLEGYDEWADDNLDEYMVRGLKWVQQELKPIFTSADGTHQYNALRLKQDLIDSAKEDKA